MIRIKEIIVYCDIQFETPEMLQQFKQKIAAAMEFEHRNIYMKYEDLTAKFESDGAGRIKIKTNNNNN